ncbi:U-box domain-containing protein 38-like [Salvia miltiorrhiza]|uniref:U-box domain-containing protein 38-like n=1 Tax=Salvia miltiorrhiza TaxID=226208 RepID=UPI0025ABA03C|nr:U-box domain-containing protein 38-like [Salvia miltiorrhiza]
MGGNGKFRRWRISFHRSPATANKDPPQEFLCPISNSLMFDPAIVSSGQTFERACVDVCTALSFAPTLADGSKPDFSTVIPNLALKTAILSWCSKTGSGRPSPPVHSEIESTIRSLSASTGTLESPKILVSEKELLKGVAETPPILFSHAATELNSRDLNLSSSSEESVIANATPLLPFATRPSCFSYSSSPSTSSEFVAEEGSTNAASINSSSEDENFITKMRSLDVYEQEQAVIQLRKTTRTSEEARATLCSERLLLALKQLLSSRYSALQTNAAAAMVNLSLEKGNKVKIVRAGAVPPLIDILKSGYDESREHAAGAIFSLALEDDNKTAIGVLGALPPLLHELRSGTRRSRHDAALALYHLTLVQSNRAKVIRLGAAAALLGLLKDRDVAARVVLTVCNLATCDEGRAALLDANAVDCLVGLLRNRAELSSESTRENCVAALHSLSDRSLRFKGLARDAGAEEVLLDVVKADSERAREKARRILEGLRGPEAAEDGEVDWEAVMKGGVTQARHRVGKSSGRNSTEF